MQPIPITVLGGSDRRAGQLPDSGSGLHALATYKGAAITLGGRPLIAHLIERLLSSGAFAPVRIAGPERIYGPLHVEAEVLDVDGTVGSNLKAALEAHQNSELVAGQPLAILACDVLPSAAELRELRVLYESQRPCAVWFPFVRLPQDPQQLGAFAWKPSYWLQPERGSAAVRVLPGHLGILQPEQLRLPLLLELMDIAYRSRNTPLEHRRGRILRSILGFLMSEDLRSVLTLRSPALTWQAVSNGLRIARGLRNANLTVAQLERCIGSIFLQRRSRGLAPSRVRYPITDFVSLAEDIDTEEEARQLLDELEERDSDSGIPPPVGG